jgi:aryl-alcohol dehydrogenase-like predicted oxidoreductase
MSMHDSRGHKQVGTRREFLVASGKLAAGAVAGWLGIEAPTLLEASVPSQVPKKVPFGWTKLRVSRLCQGTAFRQVTREGDDPNAQIILRRALELGVNFFDTSNAYGWGGSEIALGKALKGARSKVVICSKVSNYLKPQGSAPAQKQPYSRPMIVREAEGSLKRLGTDYLDLYLIHNSSEGTPPEEIVEAMHQLVQSGKIRYWGLSNHSDRQVAEFLKLSSSSKKTRMAGLEDYYNIVAGERLEAMDRKMFPLIRQARLGLMAYSPLGEGRLAPGRNVESGSALEAVIKALDGAALELGATRPQVCIAWVLARAEVTSVLAGAERPEHVEDNLKGTLLKLPSAVLKKLNDAGDEYARRAPRKPAS